MFIMHRPADKRPFPNPDVHSWFLTVDDVEDSRPNARYVVMTAVYVIGADIIFLP